MVKFKTLNEKLMLEISKLDAVTFLGLCKLLGVSIVKEKEPKQFADLLEEVMQRFDVLGRPMKKEILGVVRDANRAKDSEEVSTSN